MILSSLVFLPLVGALLLLVIPRDKVTLIRSVALRGLRAHVPFVLLALDPRVRRSNGFSICGKASLGAPLEHRVFPGH